MAFLVFCTFDLKGANAADYQNAYADLDKLGLKKVHKNSSGRDTVIPTTSTMGFFDGVDASTISRTLRDRVLASFKARRFKSEIFLVVGDDWAWIADVT